MKIIVGRIHYTLKEVEYVNLLTSCDQEEKPFFHAPNDIRNDLYIFLFSMEQCLEHRRLFS